jgi:hypothetical protein
MTSGAAATICTRVFRVEGVVPSGSGSGTTAPAADGIEAMNFKAGECQRAGGEWENMLRAMPGNSRGNFTMLVFARGRSGQGDLCWYNREYGVTGDPIFVAAFAEEDVAWTGSRYEPCALQPAAPNVLISGEKFHSATHSGTGVFKVRTFLSRRCYNAAVDVSVVGKAGTEDIQLRYPLSQYQRYRATVQAGILFTSLHDSDFALRRDQADTSKRFIFDKGPSDTGPEYIATLQLYSILKYLPSLAGVRGGNSTRIYEGRDILHDQGFFDRIGGIVGVGITNPGKRFVGGVTFEVIYGISAMYVYDFARVRRLADDVSMDEPFIGSEEDIATVSSWKGRNTWGISLDLRYLSNLFSANR